MNYFWKNILNFYENLWKIWKNIFFKIFIKIKYFYIIYDKHKNKISILRNILKKSNDQDLIDHVIKKILPEIFDFYIENYINPNIIYNIDNCYTLYYPNLYNKLSKNYKLTTQETLIFRKKYERVNYSIKLLKDKNINVKKP